MRLGPAGISVTSAHRYASAAGSCWPVSIMPAPGELLSSWLHRLAYANGVPPRYFGGFLEAPGENWSARLDRALPDRILGLLVQRTGVPLEDIAALTVAPDPWTRLRLPLQPRSRGTCASGTQATWLQFCPACLAEDETPYFRRGWSLATRVSCFRHGCLLRDRCPNCGGGLAPFLQDRLLPQQICAFCAAPLVKRTLPATPCVRHLERLLDDLLRLHAAGYGPRGRTSPIDLLGATCFRSGDARISIAYLSHVDRYRLFRRLTEDPLRVFGERKNPALDYWAHVVRVAPSWRRLTSSFADAVLCRPAAGSRSASPRLHLTDLVQTAAQLHRKRQAP